MNHILSIPNLYLPEDLEEDINKKKNHHSIWEFLVETI